MKSFFAFIALLVSPILIGCATTSAPAFYRERGGQKQHEVTAKMDHSIGKLTVYVDGVQAIDKMVPPFAGNAFEAEGTWNGKPVRASVVRVQNFASAYTRVTVFIDGEYAAVLTI